MKLEYKVFLKHAMHRWRTLAGIIVIPLVLFFASLGDITTLYEEEMLVPLDSAFLYALQRLKGQEMAFIVPIICTFPYAASFAEDIKSRYIRNILTRSTKRGYILGKYFACAVSGGLTVIFGAILSIIVIAIAYVPITNFTQEVHLQPVVIELMAELVLIFISAAFWAGIGMFAAALSQNIHVAYLAPFIVFYVLEILFERYFPQVYILSPMAWLAPPENLKQGNLLAGILVFEFLMLSTVAFRIYGEKKLEIV